MSGYTYSDLTMREDTIKWFSCVLSCHTFPKVSFINDKDSTASPDDHSLDFLRQGLIYVKQRKEEMR